MTCSGFKSSTAIRHISSFFIHYPVCFPGNSIGPQQSLVVMSVSMGTGQKWHLLILKRNWSYSSHLHHQVNNTNYFASNFKSFDWLKAIWRWSYFHTSRCWYYCYSLYILKPLLTTIPKLRPPHYSPKVLP